MNSFKIGLFTLLILYGLGVLTLYVLQNRLIYINSKEVVSPASVGLPQAELVSFNTQDNETITGWFIAPKPNKPLILYFHGNAGRLQLYHKRFEILVSEGAGLLAITYRGYGASTGSPTEQGLYLDADAALAHALNLGFKPAQIVVIADSLGTGVATYLAQKHAFAGLVLDSPFTSLNDVVSRLFFFVPTSYLLQSRFPSLERIGQIKSPLLIIHGTNDKTVRYELGQRLFAQANAPKQFISVPNQGHLALGTPLGVEATLRFLRQF